MKAEILNGHLHIYPDTAQDEKELLEFRDTGVNSIVGTVCQVERNGTMLPEKELLFIQITKKGTALTSKIDLV